MIRRLSLIALLAAALSPLASAVTKNKPFPEYHFSKGVDTYHSPTSIPDGYVQNSLNGLFDDMAPFTKRAGYTVAWTTKTYSYQGLWTYADGTNTTWQIARSSDQITATNLQGLIVKVATVSVNNLVGETNAFGDAWFVDQSNGVYFWNGSTTTYVSGSPLGSIITSFHGRLWVTGVAVPYGNQLYGSQYFNGQVWTTGLNDTDPVQYSIGLQDNFDNTTAEYVYLDTLYLFKHSSIYALYGFGQSTFQISQLTQECGCIDGGTIQTYNSGLEFVSLRGLEKFNGYSCTRISDAIKNKIDPAIQTGAFSQSSWVQSTTQDWQSGTITPSGNLSTTISPPALTVSTFGATSSFSQSVVTDIPNNSFELPGSCSGMSNWTLTGGMTCGGGLSFGDTHCPSGIAKDGVQTINDRAGLFSGELGIYSNPGNTLISSTTIPSTSSQCSYVQVSVPGSQAAGQSVTIQIKHSSAKSVSDPFVSNGNNITLWWSADNTSGGGWEVAYDLVGGSPIQTALSTTSIVYDTTFTSSVAQVQAEWSGVAIASYTLFSSVNQSGPFAPALTSTGTSAYVNRYVFYSATYTYSSPGTVLSNTEIVAAATGTFKSQIHNTGAMNSWGNFSVSEVLNGGTIAFSVCSSTNSNMSFPESCTNQTLNSQILSSTGTYVQWYATFTVTAATQTPTLQSATIQWFSGTKAIPMASTVWDNRYWLALTTNTADTGNDAVVVLNKDGAFALFDLHAGAFTQYKNSLYHADSLGSGNIYLDNQGWADNGNPINVFLNTRNESLGDLTSDDYMYALYPTASSTGNCPMTVQYAVDNSTTNYSLGSPLLNEFSSITSVRLPFPIDSAHQVFGQSVDFTLGTNDGQCGFQLLGLEGLFKSRPIQ